MRRLLGPAVPAFIVLCFAVACSSPPAQAPAATSQVAAATKTAPTTAPASAPTVSAPAGATTAPATGQSAAVANLDPDLQKVYAEAVKVIPNLSPEVLAGAKKEGSLSLYRFAYDVEAGAYPEFKKLFPFIQITDFTATVAALLERYSSEARSGRTIADVVWSSDINGVDALEKEGLIQHYEVSSASALMPVGRKDVYYPFQNTILSNAYNTDLVSEEDAKILESWDGILDPKWKGKAGIQQYGVGAVAIVPIYWAVQEKGQDFFDRLIAQEPLVFNSMPVEVERLAAGGLSVLFFANDANLMTLYTRGAPIRWKAPDPALSTYSVQFIAKNAPHPNAARLWVEWLTSKQGQSVWMKTIGQGTARTDMSDERPFVKESWYKSPTTFYKYSWDDIAAQRDKLQQLWSQRASQLKAGS